MKKYNSSSIKKIVGELPFINSEQDKYFTKPASISSGESNTITWIKGIPENIFELLNNTKASFLVCSDQIDGNLLNQFPIVFIKSPNPKQTFITILAELFKKNSIVGIHNSSIVSKSSRLGENCYIGPNVIIEDDCIIGDGTRILGNNYIFSNSIIGKNVTINPGTVIGSDGFGYARDENNELIKFPHYGGVIIEDDVEIGANVCIDRGTLDHTIIMSGTKIDNLVHVAHNVIIGKHCLLIANSMIGGSTSVGDGAWIAPSVNLMNGISIGKNVVVGMGATVTKSIPDSQTWAGSPAMPLEEFIKLRKKINDL